MTVYSTYKSKRRRKRVNPAAVIAVILVIAAIIGIGAYFGYNLYERKTHPLEYENYVERYSKEFGVDKYLVYAVIKTESGFHTDAVSNVGARGLMQIMETTFDWIKNKMGDDERVYYDMFKAEQNIRYGCWLLGYLYEEFGNVECVAAAYHAGRGNVNEWLADKRYSKDGKHLDNIPIKDTAHYVFKITRAMDTYIRLYDK